MADYYLINNFSQHSGHLGISRDVFLALANTTIEQLKDDTKIKMRLLKIELLKPLVVHFHHNGLVTIRLYIQMKKHDGMLETIERLQQEISDNITQHIGQINLKIDINLLKFR